MKRVSIISKPGKPELGKVAREVSQWLLDHGYHVTADTAALQSSPGCEPAEPDQIVEKRPDYVVVLGGDGTLLSAARKVAASGIPILGVNLGSLGFLTEIRQDEIAWALAEVDRGRCQLSLRSMIHCQVVRDRKCVATYDALNDVVINQSAVARITEFEVQVDGNFVSKYQADGMIVATPTGSTAYSLSAGGPILVPDVPGFIITPVASHALTNRPLVVRDTTEIKLVVRSTPEEAYLTVDGQSGMQVVENDEVLCRKSAHQY